MVKYKCKYCVVGQLTARQKLMAARLLRDSAENVVAMDEYNAEVKNLNDEVENAVMFQPYAGMDPTEEELDLIEGLGWSGKRIVVEGEDFEVGTIPGEEKGRC